MLAVALGDDGEHGSAARVRLRGEVLAAPELIDPEVISVFRRFAMSGLMTSERSEAAVADLTDLALRRAPHRLLLQRCWELRQNLTSYDACYVALAETLEVPLLTSDRRLARAPGTRCAIELFA
ncbi:type II toxin-antitoxin system VapC family toxin [Nakamurella sp. GG22]